METFWCHGRQSMAFQVTVPIQFKLFKSQSSKIIIRKDKKWIMADAAGQHYAEVNYTDTHNELKQTETIDTSHDP